MKKSIYHPDVLSLESQNYYSSSYLGDLMSLHFSYEYFILANSFYTFAVEREPYQLGAT